ncbi:hypothetical protein C8J57DRAFT_1381455 [Mycena rebaudengoi]|nr:hypothetical protein C8J57DRAFT_1381455 [Mycena rebaudengoi]
MSAPFSTKLGTNYCPRDDEVLEISRILLEPSLRLKRLDEEISTVRMTLDKLATERDELGNYVDGYRALISPARRLPHDLVQEIFIACLPSHRNCVMSASEAPVLLGRICSAWRKIALSTPRLWTRLHVAEPSRPFNFFPPTLFDDKLAQRLEITRQWLARSGECRLSISLDSNHDVVTPPLTPTPPHPNSGRFMNELTPFAHRWQHISFTVSPMALAQLTSLSEEDVPLLETVEIFPRPEPAAHSTDWASFAFLRGPSITGFSLHGSNVNPLDLPLRWGQLKFLSLVGHGWSVGDSLTSEAALHVLTKCPQLQSCRILISDGTSSPDSFYGNSIVELPLLETLSIESVGIPALTVRTLFSRLSLPGLRHFDFRGRSENGDSLGPFLAASTRLESVDIDTETFSQKSLIELLRDLPPSLRRLQITDRVHRWGAEEVLNDAVMAVLTPSPSRPVPCCPALRELNIPQCRAFSDEALSGFIRGRLAAEPRTLKRVEARFNRDMQVDVVADLRPFIDEAGLKVLLYYLAPPVWQFSPWQGLADAPRPPWAYPTPYGGT